MSEFVNVTSLWEGLNEDFRLLLKILYFAGTLAYWQDRPSILQRCVYRVHLGILYIMFAFGVTLFLYCTIVLHVPYISLPYGTHKTWYYPFAAVMVIQYITFLVKRQDFYALMFIRPKEDIGRFMLVYHTMTWPKTFVKAIFFIQFVPVLVAYMESLGNAVHSLYNQEEVLHLDIGPSMVAAIMLSRTAVQVVLSLFAQAIETLYLVVELIIIQNLTAFHTAFAKSHWTILPSNNSHVLVREKLHRFIRRHQFIIAFVEHTNRFFSCFVMYWHLRAISILGLTAVEYSGKMGGPNKFSFNFQTTDATYFVFAALKFLLMCWLAENIKRKSISLEAICLQHMHSIRHRDLLTDLRIMAIRCHVPLEMYAGPFNRLGMRMFASAITFSFTYYMFLLYMSTRAKQ